MLPRVVVFVCLLLYVVYGVFVSISSASLRLFLWLSLTLRCYPLSLLHCLANSVFLGILFTFLSFFSFTLKLYVNSSILSFLFSFLLLHFLLLCFWSYYTFTFSFVIAFLLLPVFVPLPRFQIFSFFLLAFLSAFLDVILFCSLSLTKPLLLVRVCLLPCRNSLFLCNRFDLADCSLVAFGFPCVRLQSTLPFCVRISILHVRPVPGLIFNDLYSTCVSSDRFHLEEISCH